MKNCFLVTGLPGAGKTHCMKAILSKLGERFPYKCGLIQGEAYQYTQVLVLGNYSEHVFAGTDRLSMAIQTDVPNFIHDMQGAPFPQWTLLGEGDRITNLPFFTVFTTLCTKPTILCLDVRSTVLEIRREQRTKDTGKGQSPSWLVGRTTKLNNFLNQAQNWSDILRLPYNDPDQTKETQEAIFQLVMQQEDIHAR